MSGSISAGSVDASIPLRAGQGVGAPLNPLEQIGKFAQVSNLLNTGQIQQQTIQANKMSLAQQQKQLAYAHIAPLVAQGRINNMADLTSAAGALEHYGINTQPFLADVARTVGQGGNFIDNLKMQTAAGMQAPENVGKAIFPSQESVDQGLVSQPFLRGAPGTPGEGVRTPSGPATPLGASPAQQGSIVEYTTSDGVTKREPWAKWNIDRGNGMVNGPGRWVDGPSAGQPVTQDAAGSTRPSGTLPTGYRGGYTPPQPAEGGGMTSVPGPAPGTEEAMKGSAGQYVQDRAGATTFATRVLPLKQGIGLLNDTNTGPGSETLNHMRSFAISLANQGLLPKGITPDAIQQAKFDELKKYMAQYITGMPFAGRSDASMATAITGAPNTNMSTLANRDLAKVIVGMERYRAAQVLKFDQDAQAGKFGAAAKSDPNAAAGRYAGFATQFNQDNDPRAFAYDLMDPKDRAKMLAKMDGDQRLKFAKSLKVAHELPGLMQ